MKKLNLSRLRSLAQEEEGEQVDDTTKTDPPSDNPPPTNEEDKKPEDDTSKTPAEDTPPSDPANTDENQPTESTDTPTEEPEVKSLNDDGNSDDVTEVKDDDTMSDLTEEEKELLKNTMAEPLLPTHMATPNFLRQSEQIIALESLTAEVKDLLSDLKDQGGISEKEASMIRNIVPNSEDFPEGYFTSQPSKTRYALSLEKLSNTMISVIAMAVAALVSLIYKFFKWIASGGKDDGIQKSTKESSKPTVNVTDSGLHASGVPDKNDINKTAESANASIDSIVEAAKDVAGPVEEASANLLHMRELLKEFPSGILIRKPEYVQKFRDQRIKYWERPEDSGLPVLEPNPEYFNRVHSFEEVIQLLGKERLEEVVYPPYFESLKKITRLELDLLTNEDIFMELRSLSEAFDDASSFISSSEKNIEEALKMLHGDHLEGSMDRVSSQLHLEALTKMLNKVNIDDLKFNFRGKRLSIEDINSEFRQSFLQKRSEIVSEINLGEIISLLVPHNVNIGDQYADIHSVGERFKKTNNIVRDYVTKLSGTTFESHVFDRTQDGKPSYFGQAQGMLITQKTQQLRRLATSVLSACSIALQVMMEYSNARQRYLQLAYTYTRFIEHEFMFNVAPDEYRHGKVHTTLDKPDNSIMEHEQKKAVFLNIQKQLITIARKLHKARNDVIEVLAERKTKFSKN